MKNRLAAARIFTGSRAIQVLESSQSTQHNAGYLKEAVARAGGRFVDFLGSESDYDLLRLALDATPESRPSWRNVMPSAGQCFFPTSSSHSSNTSQQSMGLRPMDYEASSLVIYQRLPTVVEVECFASA